MMRKNNTDNNPSLLFNSENIKEREVSQKISRLFLIDANSMIHRAFHALPTSLKNSKGQIVNAAYGFANMLVKIIKEFSPDAVIAAFDSKAPTFRHEAFKEYKANRPETADELIPQFNLSRIILDAFDIPIVEMQGFEADDIIATLAEQAKNNGLMVYIISGDRDMLQLIKDGINVITTKKGVSEVKIYDRDAVYERFNVFPEEIPDFLALKGEASDNIPGVPGIGEKTAAELVRRFGSIEKIYENLESLKGKRFYESLKENRENVFLAKKLAILRKDVPIQLQEYLRNFYFDKNKVAKVFFELEFQTLLKRLDIAEKGLEVEVSITEPSVYSDFSEVLEIAESTKKGFLAIVDENLVFSAGKKYSELNQKSLLDELFSRDFEIFTNDLKGLYKFLPAYLREILIHRINLKMVNDHSILLWLLNPDKKKYSLNDYFEGDDWKVHLGDVLKWSEKLLERIKEEDMEDVYYLVELKLPAVLAEMEESGLPVNLENLYELKKELERQIDNEESEIYNLSGVRFNIDSPKQLGYILYEVLKIKPSRKSKKKNSTEQQVLMDLIDAHPIIEHILNYRELTKLKRTYVEPFIEKVDPITKRIYGKFIQTGTATGRLSSEDPNLQNIPLKGAFSVYFRESIRCESGRVFVAADYANIDLRVLAHLSQDEKLLEAFSKNVDIHSQTAMELFKVSKERVDERLRRIAKAINFGIVYGVSPEGLAQQAGISQDEAREYIERYFEEHPGVKDYIEKTIKKAYEDGFVQTILKRRRYLPGLKSSSIAERNAAQRLAMNTPVQGSAADIVKLAMIKLWEEIRRTEMDAKIVLQVHDSLILETEEELADAVSEILKYSMENAYDLSVPLVVNLKVSNSLAGL
ncbi:MAG: DNA polymerase I [Actinobacteria bacterium]|nr:DNA polymerase I [Actinomycetota bacterium]